MVSRLLKVFVGLSTIIAAANAVDLSNCGMCHKAGGAAPAPPAGLTGSPHTGISCLECHTGAREPHNEGAGTLWCTSCHRAKGETLSGSVHGRGAPGSPNCYTCHGSGHAVITAGTGRLQPSYAPKVCFQCHSDIVEQFLESAHAKAAANNEPRAPGCSSCHGSTHSTRDVDSSENLSAENLPNFCGTCHAGETPTRGVPHTLPYRMLFLRKGVHEEIVDDTGRLDARCPDCHSTHGVQPATKPGSTVYFTEVAKTCGNCHPTEYRLYSISIHGTATAAGIEEAPTCPDCHYSYGTRESAGLSMTKRVALCTDCHSDRAKMERYGVDVKRVEEYRHTFHGKAIHYDYDKAADCVDCHTAHMVLPADDERSSIAKANILATCSTEGCHTGATGSFGEAGGHLMDRGEGADTVQMWTTTFFIWLTRSVIALLVLHIIAELQRELPARIRATRKKRERLLIKERVGGSVPLICVLSQIKKREELIPENNKALKKNEQPT